MDNNMRNNKNFNKVSNIIESLTVNPNPDSVAVLEEIGTNSSIDEVREMTSRALVKRNEHDSLNVVIANRGKGINDMSTVVAMSTINELLSLSQRFEVAKMLMDKRTYLDISEKTGASTATISRVNRSLNYGNDGYDMVFKRMEEKKEQNRSLDQKDE